MLFFILTKLESVVPQYVAPKKTLSYVSTNFINADGYAYKMFS